MNKCDYHIDNPHYRLLRYLGQSKRFSHIQTARLIYAKLLKIYEGNSMKIKAQKQIIESILINLQPFLEKKMQVKSHHTFFSKLKTANVSLKQLTLK